MWNLFTLCLSDNQTSQWSSPTCDWAHGLLALSRAPPQFRSQLAAWERHVHDHWLMRRAEPCETTALCPVSVCQKPCNTVRACLTSRFHTLSASERANSCVSHQKWFQDVCIYTVCVCMCLCVCRPEGEMGVTGSGDWEERLQIKVRCALYSTVLYVRRFINNSLNCVRSTAGR